MLQNRVDPFGNIIKTSARGALMGNRGVLHNDKKEITRPYKLIAWISCRLEFKGRKRQVMMPDRWTELFFLDEATSFAAGHRPCFECRREDAVSFKLAWLKGNPAYGFNERTAIKEIDKILHKERVGRNREKIMFEEDAEKLPGGTFVVYKNEPYLLKNGLMYLWTPSGYEAAAALPAEACLQVLTPRSVVNAFRAGYVPQMAV